MTEKATFAAGCFWGVEEAFRTENGVLKTSVGYTGGTKDNPKYEEVCADRTGHAEAIEVEFDPKKVTFEKLLDIFWRCHDPTQINRQGPDVGKQYRSAIFYHSKEQMDTALKSKSNIEASKRYSHPIATDIVMATSFWPAEEYHQKYLLKRGKNTCN